MIENVEGKEGQNRFNPHGGLGLYKIRYEMDIKGENKSDQGFIAGILAFSNEEAIQALLEFCKKNVKGFKGFKVEEIGFDGACHEMSEQVKIAVVNRAIKAGEVISKPDFEAKVAQLTKNAKSKATRGKKTSILPKD